MQLQFTVSSIHKLELIVIRMVAVQVRKYFICLSRIPADLRSI